MNVKLVGSFKPNPETGQLTADFENLPQAPFDDIPTAPLLRRTRPDGDPDRLHDLHHQRPTSSPGTRRCPIRNPARSSASNPVPTAAECPGQIRPFDPSLEAGTSNPTAGAFSSFTLKLNREDGDQYLGKLNFTMPPGLTANLHGVTYCPEADIAAAARHLGQSRAGRPELSGVELEIGTSNVAAGPGSHPFHAVGKIYLAGPFQGAPLSLVAITPALAGPYDYGTVVVRVALHIDPLDAHVIADSETVPEIIGGIPIRMRSIQVNINKPNFMINPTNCSPFSVASEGVGDQGTAVAFSSYFHAVNCAALRFAPKMSITQLGGHKATARSKDPSLAIELNTRPGDANIKSLSVTLPKAFEIDQRHLGNICDRTELASDQCAGRQPIGEATTKPRCWKSPSRAPSTRSPASERPAPPRLHPRRPGDADARGRILLGPRRAPKDRRPGGPRRPDRPLPLHPLRRPPGLPLKHPEPLQRPDRLHGRIHRPKRQDPDPAGEDQDRLQGEEQKRQSATASATKGAAERAESEL